MYNITRFFKCNTWVRMLISCLIIPFTIPYMLCILIKTLLYDGLIDFLYYTMIVVLISPGRLLFSIFYSLYRLMKFTFLDTTTKELNYEHWIKNINESYPEMIKRFWDI